LSDLNGLNETAPHFMTPALDWNECIHGRPQKFFQRDRFEIVLILLRLLTIQCKWTCTKRITLSTPLVCAGWNSILNLLS